MRKVYKKQSLWSRVVNFSLIFFDDKANSASEKAAARFINKNSVKELNYKIYKKFSKEIIDNQVVFSYNGSLSQPKNKIILYVHGGNFVQQANKFQIDFAMRVADETNATLVVPIYERLPKGNYKKMYNFLNLVYDKMLIAKPDRIIFMGDSAGGGAVLSFAMQLKDKNVCQPSDIVLISPWLDLSMTNPKLYDDEKNDKMNCVDGVRYEGMLWADGDNVVDPLISPMYGTFDGLGRISLIFGGKGILSSECKRFDEILSRSQIEHNYIFYENEGHDFAVFPTKEAKNVLEIISEILNEL